jgi:hypothetical protein
MAGRNVIERALDIASACGTIQDLKRQLIREGFQQVNAHLSGWKIRRQLLCRLTRKA